MAGEENKAMILVTGCSGFVGSHLVNALVDEGFEARCLVRGTKSLEQLPSDRSEFAVGIDKLCQDVGPKCRPNEISWI